MNLLKYMNKYEYMFFWLSIVLSAISTSLYVFSRLVDYLVIAVFFFIILMLNISVQTIKKHYSEGENIYG